jgi:DNA-directed RNA polymerase specialized sigma24 family protein
MSRYPSTSAASTNCSAPPACSHRGIEAHASPPLWTLLARARSSESRALDELLVNLHAVVVRWLRRRSSGHGAVLTSWHDDIAAEALARAAVRLDTCRATDDGALISWVLALTRRVVVDYTRARWYRVEWATDCATLELVNVFDTAAGPGTSLDEGFDREATESTLIDALMAAYDALPDTSAELLWRRLVASESWEEIGTALATTPGGARRRFDRVRGHLRRNVLARLRELPPEHREAALRSLDGRRGGDLRTRRT